MQCLGWSPGKMNWWQDAGQELCEHLLNILVLFQREPLITGMQLLPLSAIGWSLHALVVSGYTMK